MGRHTATPPLTMRGCLEILAAVPWHKSTYSRRNYFTISIGQRMLGRGKRQITALRQAAERMRFGGTFMAASATCQYQGILAKLVAQFLDVKCPGHAADCYDTASGRPSSTGLL